MSTLLSFPVAILFAPLSLLSLIFPPTVMLDSGPSEMHAVPHAAPRGGLDIVFFARVAMLLFLARRFDPGVARVSALTLLCWVLARGAVVVLHELAKSARRGPAVAPAVVFIMAPLLIMCLTVVTVGPWARSRFMRDGRRQQELVVKVGQVAAIARVLMYVVAASRADLLAGLFVFGATLAVLRGVAR